MVAEHELGEGRALLVRRALAVTDVARTMSLSFTQHGATQRAGRETNLTASLTSAFGLTDRDGSTKVSHCTARGAFRRGGQAEQFLDKLALKCQVRATLECALLL